MDLRSTFSRSISRRLFLAGAAGVATLGAWRGSARASAPARTLVLVKLAGGNDSLNMVAPAADPDYRRLRPTIGLGADEVLPLADGLGLNPAMASLMASWADGEMAVVGGLGLPAAERSHFSAMDIWETGREQPGADAPGWLTEALLASPRADADPHGLIIGSDPGVALAGRGTSVLHLRPPLRSAAPSASLDAPVLATANPALAHILNTHAQLQSAHAALDTAIARLPDLEDLFPRTDFGRRMAAAAGLIAAGLEVPVMIVPLAGFDTHAGQRAVHDRLLTDLAEGIAAFRAALVAADRWPSVLLATYSEFGRRAAENGSGGTDHGAAASHIVIGADVVGGLHGDRPRLDRLVDGDLAPAIDFRRYWRTLADYCFAAQLNADGLGNHASLDIINH